jgi:hypothetical protein
MNNNGVVKTQKLPDGSSDAFLPEKKNTLIAVSQAT